MLQDSQVLTEKLPLDIHRSTWCTLLMYERNTISLVSSFASSRFGIKTEFFFLISVHAPNNITEYSLLKSSINPFMYFLSIRGVAGHATGWSEWLGEWGVSKLQLIYYSVCYSIIIPCKTYLKMIFVLASDWKKRRLFDTNKWSFEKSSHDWLSKNKVFVFSFGVCE